MILFLTILIQNNIDAQKTPYLILDQRLKDIEKDAKNLENQRDKYAIRVKILEQENIQLRTIIDSKKEFNRNENELRLAIQKLYDAENKLKIRIGEVGVLQAQVQGLKSENLELQERLRHLSHTDSLLKVQLDNAKAQIANVSSDFNPIKEEAMNTSLVISLRNPKTQQNKFFSILTLEGGFLNVTQGFSTKILALSYSTPSRNLLGGFSTGIDFYNKHSVTRVDDNSLFFIPISTSFRGNFGPQDFFSTRKGSKINYSWMFDFGWALIVKDTDFARSFGGNALMNGGISALWPSSYENLGIGASATIKVQRIKKFDNIKESTTAELLSMLVLSACVYLK